MHDTSLSLSLNRLPTLLLPTCLVSADPHSWRPSCSGGKKCYILFCSGSFFAAQISFSRGKKRYLFDFRFELKWEASDLVCGPAKGVLVYPDVGQDCDGEYDVECQVRRKTAVVGGGIVSGGAGTGRGSCFCREARSVRSWVVA